LFCVLSAYGAGACGHDRRYGHALGDATPDRRSLAIGTRGQGVGIIAIVVTGLGFAFAEGGSVMRRGIGIVFGLAIAFTATTFITSFFNVTSGAVF
jgi:type IV secretion system protein VirB2